MAMLTSIGRTAYCRVLEILAACLHPEVFADLRETHASCVIRVDEHLSQHAM